MFSEGMGPQNSSKWMLGEHLGGTFSPKLAIWGHFWETAKKTKLFLVDNMFCLGNSFGDTAERLLEYCFGHIWDTFETHS